MRPCSSRVHKTLAQPPFGRKKRLRRGELEHGQELLVAVGKRTGNFRQGGGQFLLKPAPDVGYGAGNGHGGVSFRVFCCLQDPLYHGEIPRPGKTAKKMPDMGTKFSVNHNLQVAPKI